MTMFSDLYRGKRVFLTGHTGFKGSWLALWLNRLGASVAGYSLPPATEPSHWNLLDLTIAKDQRADIRDFDTLNKALHDFEPQIVFHLAAQPLVRASYRDPLETWSTNVMGTANLLESCRTVPGLQAVVVITTDKCYENIEADYAYKETDKLGGHDPYSASKAGTELVTASYRKSFFYQDGSPLVASARAGNVIGGGDYSADRLLPDLARAMQRGAALEIRSPNATRPWQHVLDALHGYLMLGERLMKGERAFADAWNFGPDSSGNRTVSDVLNIMKKYWPDVRWEENRAPQLHEATLLQLDTAKARGALDWTPVWGLEEALRQTALWYESYIGRGKVVSEAQLDGFIKGAGRI